MKKKLLYLCLCLLAVACTAENQGETETTSALRITTDGIATRMAINGNQFEAEDRISLSLYDLEDHPYSTVPNADNGNNWFWYKYDGTGWNSENSWKGEPMLTEQYVRVYAVYPTTDGDLLKSGQWVNIAPQNNVQQEYLLAVSDGKNNSRQPVVNLQFHYMLSLVTVNLTKGVNEEIHVDKVALKNSNNSTAISTTGNLDVKTGTIATLSSSSSNVSIVKTVDKSLSAAALVSTQFLVIPTKTSDGVVLSVTIGNKEHKVRVPSTTWEKGKKYTYNVTVNTTGEKVLSISEAIITPRDNTDMETLYTDNKQTPSVGGTIGTPVDLGFSVKWADHNVGASIETEAGGYFVWGDPTGEFAGNQYLGNLPENICGTQYDIATTQWGKGWRMPQSVELKELMDNCNAHYETANGISGMRFTSKINGKSIFVPACGWKDGTNIIEKDASICMSGETVNGNIYVVFNGSMDILSRGYTVTPVYNRFTIRPVYVNN